MDYHGSFHKAGAVDPVLAFTTLQQLTSAPINQAYTYPLVAAGLGQVSYLKLSATGANVWAVSSTGVVSGIPHTISNDTVTVQATDARGRVTVQTFNISVWTFGWPDPLPAAQVGVPYSYQLTVLGGIAPITYGLAAGATLPAGFSVSASGLVTNSSPATAVTLFATTFSATDSS